MARVEGMVMGKVWILVLVIAVGFATDGFAESEKKDDAVFLDEGDGDFDPVPSVEAAKPAGKATVSKPEVRQESQPVETAAGKTPDKEPDKAAGAEKEALPEVQPDSKAESQSKERAGHNPKIGKKAVPSKGKVKESSAESPVASSAPTLAPSKAPSKTASKAANKAANKAAKNDAGIYVTTKTVCPIRREPASESEEIAKTKAPRKIWVQKVDANWVRAYVKSGDPGFINMECFEK